MISADTVLMLVRAIHDGLWRFYTRRECLLDFKGNEMKIEHKLEPIEHWIVDGKAYRLATEVDVGKSVARAYHVEQCLREIAYGEVRILVRIHTTEPKYDTGQRWPYAIIQDDSLLSPPMPQRTPVPEPKPIDWTKPVRTKMTKWPVTLITVKGRGDYPIIGYVGDNTELSHWDMNGESPGYAGKDYDGLENAPQRIQREYWVNVYPDSHAFCEYKTRQQADEAADSNRFACVKITIDCEEGEGL